MILAGWLAAGQAAGQAAAAPPAGFGGPFSLTDGAGETITDTSFPGKFLLLFFGYTNCPDDCPTVMYKISLALSEMGAPAGRLQAIFITIDPKRDTPEIASRYATLFSPDILGLSGTAAEVSAVERAYHVYVGAPDPKSGAIAHGTLLYLVGPDGGFITALPGDLSAAALATKLTAILEK
jgi:protein SCO1/2